MDTGRPSDEDYRVQQPEDPAALGEQMDRMKEAADEVIRDAVDARQRGEPRDEVLRRSVRAILRAMQPLFGPANAWWFNERDRKLAELCERLGGPPEVCEKPIEEEPEAQEVFRREVELMREKGETEATTVLRAWRIGDMGFVSLPGEPFVELGLRIKRESPFPWTYPVGYAGDHLG